MDKRHIRQSFLGNEVGEVTAMAKATIVGLCGGGSHVSQQLAHIGVGHFNLVDHDRVEDHNGNRMVGLTAEEAERNDLKVDVIARRILAVNPNAVIHRYPTRWEEVAAELKSSTTIFGCVDSYRVRDELERFARRYLVPYIDVGMDINTTSLGFSISGQMILSLPDHPCMRCFGFITEQRLTEEARRYGHAGGRPQVVWPNGMLASTAVGTFMQLILPWSKNLQPPLFLEYDGNRMTVSPSHKVAALSGRCCPHFSGSNTIGDIDWT
jgi:hypothetical protein